MTGSMLATVTDIDLRPDPARVIAKTFIPGLEDVGPTGSRAGAVVDRVLRMDDAQVNDLLAELVARFGDRHRDLLAIFDANAGKLIGLLDSMDQFTPARRRLLGAYFTHEFAIEGAALANPSIVPHPVQRVPGELRFIMSVRCIGEGHRSSIGFRTGTIGAHGSVTVDTPSRYSVAAPGSAGTHHRSVFHTRLDHLGHGFEEVSRLLSMLPTTFEDSDLTAALSELAAATRRPSADLVSDVTELSRWSYQADFPERTEISERVLWPHAPPEYHGMEDARFVRFVDDDGDARYLATYTAYDRSNISLQLLETRDFRTFTSSPVAGAAAVGKGLALFPRRIGGRFAALTRSDRESNGVATSDDLRHWATAEPLQMPTEPWELIQVGNCGSPIETERGWLVLTHGVGAMRTYCIGALLLDLERPSRLLARTVTPILTADATRQDGYVPNVVYSCGALASGDTLVMPFGIADQRIGVATASITALIDSMEPPD